MKRRTEDFTFHVYLHKIWEYFGHGPPNCTNVLIRTKQVQKTHMILTQEENLIWYEIRSRRLWITFSVTTQKMKFSIKDFSSKCDQIRRKLRIWSFLLEKPLMENFIFCAVCVLAYDLGNLGQITKPISKYLWDRYDSTNRGSRH